MSEQKTSANEMSDMASRSERLISALTGAIMSTMEVATERLELAASLASARQRMDAFGSVLEAIEAQRGPILERLAGAGPAMKKLYERQLELLASQEVGILQKAGIAPEVAQKAIALADAPALPEESAPTHRRNGRSFQRVNGAS